MSTRKLTQLALLISLSIVLRYVFGPFPNIKPITAIFLVIAGMLGIWEAIIVSSLTMIITGFLLGFGPWILWQMATYALILSIFKYLVLPISQSMPQAVSLAVQTIFAGGMGFLYGFIISMFSAVFYGSLFWPYWLSGLSYDALHAVSTFLFYPIIVTIFRRFYDEKNHL